MVIDLQKIGLSAKEESVYLALLNLGPASISDLTKQAGLNRTTGYDVVTALLRKGLVTQSARRGKKIFLAEPPDRLAVFADQESRKWCERVESARSLLPVLSSLYRTTEGRPVIRYFEGIEGIEQIYEDSLTAKDMIRAYSAVEEMKDLMGDYMERYYQRRTKKRIYIRAITKSGKFASHLKRVEKSFYREVRLVPSDKFDFTLERYIYNDKVAYMSFRDRFGVIIESKDIAKSEKYIYELAWQAAGKYDVEIEKKLKERKIVS